MSDQVKKPKLITPKVRLSFPWFDRPQPPQQVGGKAKYGCSLIFDAAAMASAETKLLIGEVKKAVAAKYGDKVPPKFRLNPFLDGSEYEQYDGFKGNRFLRVSSVQRPGLVDRDRNPVDEVTSVFYPGCYVRATLNVFCYDNSGNKGVSFGLNNVQFICDGDSLGNRSRPEEDF
jgi:hypothetical protein